MELLPPERAEQFSKCGQLFKLSCPRSPSVVLLYYRLLLSARARARARERKTTKSWIMRASARVTLALVDRSALPSTETWHATGSLVHCPSIVFLRT